MNRDLHPIVSVQDNQLSDPGGSYAPDRFSSAASLHLQFQRYWTALRRRWWIVALCLLFIGVPAVIYAVIKPPRFQSEAIMWLTSKLNLPGGAGFFSEEVSSYMNTQAELMKSPAIQLRAIQRLRADFPEFASYDTNQPVASIPFTLKISGSPKSSVLNLQVIGHTPGPTRVFLDAIMDEYLDLKKGTHQQTSVGALAGITDQIKEVEKQTTEQQERLSAFERSNNISYLTEHGLSAGSHLAKLDELLSDLRTEDRLLELLTPEQFADSPTGEQNATTGTVLQGERAARAGVLAVQPSDSAYYTALQQLQLLKAKREEFARVLRPTHSKMVKLNLEISGLDQLLKTLKNEGSARALAQMANRKKSIEVQIEGLQEQRRSWETNASEASIKLAEHERLKQDLVRSQALYDRLIGLVQQVDSTRNLDQEPLSPLSRASMARPVHSAFKVAAAGVFLALAAGFGILLLLETLDDRFISAAELSCHLPEEVIGQIPETPLSLTKNGSRLLPAPQEQHAFTESFRSLRSSLFFMFDESARPRVILLTSSVPKEGKSTVAAHLAASLALSGSKVVVVDADLRRPTLHQIFGVSPKPGLQDVLAQNLPIAEAVVPVRVPEALAVESGAPDSHSAAKLFLLPCGESAGAGAEILLSSKVGDLLKALAAQYDYVIIDSPPMLATDDAMALASKVDGVFVVVRAAYTYSRMVREALDRLHKRHIKVLGLVYNRAASSKDYYYRYSRDYHNVA